MVKFAVEMDPDAGNLVAQLEGDADAIIKFGLENLAGRIKRHNSGRHFQIQSQSD
ncbi:MAG: hypothetical protein M0033_06925 [Nitrospiraceae bacterium]|nr:hypothetical protein [Nitrospiraceae bacterium]